MTRLGMQVGPARRQCVSKMERQGGAAGLRKTGARPRKACGAPDRKGAPKEGLANPPRRPPGAPFPYGETEKREMTARPGSRIRAMTRDSLTPHPEERREATRLEGSRPGPSCFETGAARPPQHED